MNKDKYIGAPLKQNTAYQGVVIHSYQNIDGPTVCGIGLSILTFLTQQPEFL